MKNDLIENLYHYYYDENNSVYIGGVEDGKGSGVVSIDDGLFVGVDTDL